MFRYELLAVIGLSLGLWSCLWLLTKIGINLFNIATNFMPPS